MFSPRQIVFGVGTLFILSKVFDLGRIGETFDLARNNSQGYSGE